MNYTLGLILLIILLLFFLAGQDESQAACNCPPGWSSGLERICGPKKCFCGGKGKYPGCAPAGAEEPAAPPVKPSRQPGCSPLAVEEAAAKAAAPHGGDQGRGRCRILPDEATVDQPIGGPPSSTKDASAHGPGGDACATCHLTPAGEHCTQQCHPTLEEWEAGLTAAAINRQRLDEDNEEDLCSASAAANAEADWQEDQFEEEVKCGGGDPIGPPPPEEDQEDRVDLGHQKPIGTLALTRTRPLAGVVALKKLWKSLVKRS